MDTVERIGCAFNLSTFGVNIKSINREKKNLLYDHCLEVKMTLLRKNVICAGVNVRLTRYEITAEGCRWSMNFQLFALWDSVAGEIQ